MNTKVVEIGDYVLVKEEVRPCRVVGMHYEYMETQPVYTVETTTERTQHMVTIKCIEKVRAADSKFWRDPVVGPPLTIPLASDNNLIEQKEETPPMTSDIQRFLEGTSDVHPEHYFVEGILEEGHSWTEQAHDYIQWCFPLMSPSLAVPSSPYLRTLPEVNALRASTLAKKNSEALTQFMLEFYGDTVKWMNHTDHNHLRISRIIQSRRLLGDKSDGIRFLSEILRYGRRNPEKFNVNAMSIAIWYDLAHG